MLKATERVGGRGCDETWTSSLPCPGLGSVPKDPSGRGWKKTKGLLGIPHIT